MMTQSPLLVEKKCDAVKQAVLALGEEVELALRQSLAALCGRDLGQARQIVDGAHAINRHRRLLMQECLLVLAAYEPAGMDLRLVGASLEIVPELDRIGDYAADTARILLRDDGQGFPAGLVQSIADMGEAAVAMFSDAMVAYWHSGGDAARARDVAARDEQVDALQREVINAIVELIRAEPEAAASGVALTWIAHLYERVADRATNIAEHVVYIATGDTPDLDC
jgi:phosphate transport system protein